MPLAFRQAGPCGGAQHAIHPQQPGFVRENGSHMFMTSDATSVAPAAEMFVKTGATYGSRPWRRRSSDMALGLLSV